MTVKELLKVFRPAYDEWIIIIEGEHEHGSKHAKRFFSRDDTFGNREVLKFFHADLGIIIIIK